MKKTKILIAVLILTFCFFTGCGKYKLELTAAAPSLAENLLTEIKPAEIKRPCGGCVFNQNIIICDYDSNCLAVFDTDLNFIKTVGKIGGEQNEFLKPVNAAVFDNMLYVLEAGNNRVQILDENFDCVKIINIDNLVHTGAGFYYNDIAVDSNGVIYVSNNSVGKLDAYITVIDTDGTVSRTKQHFNGTLAEYNGTVFALDTLEIFYNRVEEWGESGNNALYAMNKTKMEKVCDLPYRYTPNDFVITSNYIAAVSSARGTLELFDQNGKSLTDCAATAQGEENYMLFADGFIIITKPETASLLKAEVSRE